MKRYLIFLAFLLTFCAKAQRVTLTFTVKDIDQSNDFIGLMLVNKTTGRGEFIEDGAFFTTKVNKKDTLLIGARGYHTEAICVGDSADKDSFHLNIVMVKLRIQLPEVTIMEDRELDEIRRDIAKLGYDQRDYMLSGIDAFNSPITFLYQQLSRRERQNRLAYELMNEQKRRDLLKELFTKYVNYNIIDLSPEQFDAFIDFIGVSDEFMKRTSQYDFIMYVKRRYQDFARINDYR